MIALNLVCFPSLVSHPYSHNLFTLAAMVRVDTVPLLLRPFFFLFGWSLGFLLYAYTWLIYHTCRISFTGADIRAQPNYILCIWHESLAPLFAVFPDMKNQAWMNHPAWFMKPVHILLKLKGMKRLCLGSTGNSGKEALAAVNGFLKAGLSSSIAIDGPAGPLHQLKPGVLLMSRDTGTPVIPLRFICSRTTRLGGWDKKVVPLPFSTIEVQAGGPVWVNAENMDSSAGQITSWLNFE